MWEFKQKATRLRTYQLAILTALFAQRKGQLFLGTRDAHVGEASLFVDVVFIDTALVRQQTLFHADQEHIRELQAFRGVQRHKLYLVELFIAFAALHHVAQRKTRDDLRQRHRFVEIGTFQHLRHPAKELVDVLHAHLRRFRAGRGFKQPGFIIDTANEIAYRRDRFTLRQHGHFLQPACEARQRFVTAPGQRLGKPHIKTGGKETLIALVRPLAELLQRRRADFALRRVHNAQKGAVVVRVRQHAQIGQQIFDFRAREERRTAGNTIRDAVLHQHLFKHPRLVVAAIQDGVIFVLRLINKVVRDKLAGDALRLMIFMIGSKHFQLGAIAQFGKEFFLKDMRVIGDKNVGGFQNAPGRSVILFKLNHLERREILA
ncbi:hypothetical protein BN130_3142 [Cronobacter malonaticus 507]|nr:hypothetical protein BN130_3142 [Cronobacter malonaticus 507]